MNLKNNAFFLCALVCLCLFVIDWALHVPNVSETCFDPLDLFVFFTILQDERIANVISRFSGFIDGLDEVTGKSEDGKPNEASKS